MKSIRECNVDEGHCSAPTDRRAPMSDTDVFVFAKKYSRRRCDDQDVEIQAGHKNHPYTMRLLDDSTSHPIDTNRYLAYTIVRYLSQR